MEKQEWLKKYDESYPKFEWFVKKYFVSSIIQDLKNAREKGDVKELDYILNKIWFELPDRHFNLIENPDGWKEFLDLIEN